MTLAFDNELDDHLPQIRARRFERIQSRSRPRAGNLLTPRQQTSLKSISTIMEYRRSSEHVFTEGDEAHFVYAVASGMVRVSRCSEAGRRQILIFMMPGDVFGFPDEGYYANSAKAVCDTALYRVPWSQFSELMRHEPDMQMSLFTRVAFDLRQAQKRIMVLGLQNVSQRLATFILDLMTHADFYDAQKRKLALPLSRFDLAEYLGTTPETVARVMAKLEKDNLIQRISPRLLEIRNEAGLERSLGGRRRALN
jgi:CRP-like cAMP-binding protein